MLQNQLDKKTIIFLCYMSRVYRKTSSVNVPSLTNCSNFSFYVNCLNCLYATPEFFRHFCFHYNYSFLFSQFFCSNCFKDVYF